MGMEVTFFGLKSGHDLKNRAAYQVKPSSISFDNS